MTIPAPSPGLVKRSKRMAAFYVSTGVVVLLTLAGTLTYRPLRLRYAIYKVRQPNFYSDRRDLIADKWLLICVEEACNGNRAAMHVVINRRSFSIPEGARTAGHSVVYRPASEQPGLFFDALSMRESWEVVRVLRNGFDRPLYFMPSVVESIPVSPEAKRRYVKDELKCLYPYLQRTMMTGAQEERQLARGTMEFLRRRLGKELADVLTEVLVIGDHQDHMDEETRWMLKNLSPAAKEAIPGLEKLLQHGHPKVRQAAAEALKKIKAAQEKDK